MIEDRLDFIEFKQKILFLKEPSHKILVFNYLTIDDFVIIRNFTEDFELKLEDNFKYCLCDYENQLFDLCPILKFYIFSAKLIAKALMSEENYCKLFINNN